VGHEIVLSPGGLPEAGEGGLDGLVVAFGPDLSHPLSLCLLFFRRDLL